MDEKLIAIIAGVVTLLGTALYFLIKWLTKTITRKDESLERLTKDSIEAHVESTNAIKELTELIRKNK